MNANALYGRSGDPAANFAYPGTQMPLTYGPRLYLTLPAEANRIFGDPNIHITELDHTVVALDPSSVYERTMRWKGMGGLGAGEPSQYKQLSNEYLDFAKGNPGMLMFGVGALTLAVLGFTKMFGRLGG